MTGHPEDARNESRGRGLSRSEVLIPRDLWRLALVLGLTVGGCGTLSESKGITRTYYGDLKLTPIQVRALIDDYALRFALRVEGTADRILAGSSSREVSRHALLWKINGISACFMAASRSDPISALSDVTILTLQMRRFFEGGAGSHLFGVGQADAVAVAWELEREILEIRNLLSDDQAGLETGMRRMEDFVERAPLTDLTFVRSSPAREYLSAVLSQDRNLFGVVEDINQTVAELQGLFVLQAAHLPKRSRWEAELLLLDADHSPVVGSLKAFLKAAFLAGTVLVAIGLGALFFLRRRS